MLQTPQSCFAGLWEQRGDLLSYSIVTRAADPSIVFLRDRMPLVLPPSMLTDWIHGTPHDASEIVLAAPEPDLSWYKVGEAVGNVRNQDAQLIEKVAC